jgi:hypothetical protein
MRICSFYSKAFPDGPGKTKDVGSRISLDAGYAGGVFLRGLRVPALGFKDGAHLVQVLAIAFPAAVSFQQFASSLPTFRHDFIVPGVCVFVHTSSDSKLSKVSGVTNKGTHNPCF